jgi:hypothetical protein
MRTDVGPRRAGVVPVSGSDLRFPACVRECGSVSGSGSRAAAGACGTRERDRPREPRVTTRLPRTNTLTPSLTPTQPAIRVPPTNTLTPTPTPTLSLL